MNTYHGQCHCGNVQVEIPEDAIGIVACHCEDCQRLHGNYFAMLVADRASVVWSGGVERQQYASSEGINRSFCPQCGSRIAKEVDGSPKLLISAGLFARDLPRKLIKHVHVQSKPDWYPLTDLPVN